MANSDYSVFEVFYDGQCPLCKREIDMIRRKDNRSCLKLTDIAAPDFQLVEGKDLHELMREIHGRDANGEFVTGVNVFREIYSRLGFGWLVKVSRFVILRHALDVGYCMFAYLRFKHASGRMKRAGIDCQQCQIEKE